MASSEIRCPVLIVKLSGLTGASRTVVSGSVDAVDINLGKLLTLILILILM